MSEGRGEEDQPRLLVDRRCLDGGDLVAAEGLLHEGWRIWLALVSSSQYT